ncbi:FAD dependent oxidoreductase [Obba rivulosa]|uniref:FAD dependent oxidoreductase n=1 Tax=Obba rivulosa TaxID=1052685 RepID=A0A8E2AMY9_9APHY|nr:FAD dependent oxidoreductase [Obba rivulosa]
MSSQQAERNIVIIGGGIIGCTTAYYIASHPKFSDSTTKVKIIEASANGVAQGASGKAGGLVAKWAYPRELVDVSFPEHVRLAKEHNGTERWGWRFVGCGSWEGYGEPITDGTGTGIGAGGERRSLEKTAGLDTESVKEKRATAGLPDDLTWVKAELTEAYSPMAPANSQAQVHPYLFTTSMLEMAKERGVEFIPGRVSAVNIDEAGGHVTGVAYTDPTSGREGLTVPATHVILAAGAWSTRLLPSLPISATRAHSITIQPPPNASISPYVLFTEIKLPSRSRGRVQRVSPEIYARPTNEVYCCGPGDNSALPDTVDDVQVDQKACESIREHVASISLELREGTVDKRQACFLPVVSIGGGPIIGEATSVAKGLIIATGHTCWGICNAPGTARAVSELVMDGKITCGNLQKLHPSRFI